MNKNNKFTGSEVKNKFTAYLLSSIRGKRSYYLKKKNRIASIETSVVEFFQTEIGIPFEESLEQRQKEELLFQEAEGVYPEWNELTDQKLVRSLLRLSEEERKLIYQHVFEGRTFPEMGLMNCLPTYRIKGIYFYAIRKVRKMMEGR